MEFMVEFMRNSLKKYPLSIMVLATICYLSFFNPSDNNFDKIIYFDKIVHFIMYGGFCSVIWFEYFLTHEKVYVNKIVWYAIVAPIFFSGLIELAQEIFTKHRGGDVFDFLFNSLGVAFAVLFSFVVTKPLMAKFGLLNRRGK
jgi:hypothetical protein